MVLERSHILTGYKVRLVSEFNKKLKILTSMNFPVYRWKLLQTHVSCMIWSAASKAWRHRFCSVCIDIIQGKFPWGLYTISYIQWLLLVCLDIFLTMLICWEETATCCGKNMKKTEETNVKRRKYRLLSCLSVFVHYIVGCRAWPLLGGVAFWVDLNDVYKLHFSESRNIWSFRIAKFILPWEG